MRKTNILLISFWLLLFLFLFFLYSPFSYFRDLLITSAITTRSHYKIATIFYDEKIIDAVMNSNSIIEPKERTELSSIIFDKTSNAKTEYERAILNRKPNQLFKKIDIYGIGYSGYLVAIYKPERISLVTAENIGHDGEIITDVAKRTEAKVLINSVGFYDPNWQSNGAIPHGIVISDYKVVSKYGSSNVGGGIVGFTDDGKLFLGKVSKDEALKMRLKYAVEFGPYLMVNGRSSIINGNGGWGVAPRTAIAQRKDGIVLFLVINGRIPSSIGATLKDLIDVFEKCGAYNAVNMDGGSSTSLVINNKIVNTPVGGGQNGLRKLPVFWMLK